MSTDIKSLASALAFEFLVSEVSKAGDTEDSAIHALSNSMTEACCEILQLREKVAMYEGVIASLKPE